MIVGFVLASYAIVANDSIQTLGTFLSSNAHRKWWVLWLYAGGILSFVVLYGWYTHLGDPSYGRLSKIPLPEHITWIYVLPPLILLFLTRYGLPVSTTFLVLTIFAQKHLGAMLNKSILGYLVAFGAGFFLYLMISKILESRFMQSGPLKPKDPASKFWVAGQWISTGFLWSQWLIQDLANIFVYLPRQLSLTSILAATAMMLSFHAYIFYSRGGEIQKIVTSKTNTNDIRSATIIDLVYGFILFYFKGLSHIPMSTTWVFIGLLAGRELAMTIRLRMKRKRDVVPVIMKDVAKAGAGLAVSVATALLLPLLGSKPKKDLVEKDFSKVAAVEKINK
tara:strand:- start:2710 stop:3717 length:1008 start_codon:yes stop_codon:yes gene_type:complete